jgi:hypothetical protein
MVEMSEFITDKDGNFVTLEREKELLAIVKKRGGNTAIPEQFEAKNGFMGMINHKTMFTVGEKGKREHVTRKKKNNIFDVGFDF